MGRAPGRAAPSSDGRAYDEVNGVRVTLIENDRPFAVMKAECVDVTSFESRNELDTTTDLEAPIEAIRLAIGERVNLGDVKGEPVSETMLVDYRATAV